MYVCVRAMYFFFPCVRALRLSECTHHELPFFALFLHSMKKHITTGLAAMRAATRPCSASGPRLGSASRRCPWSTSVSLPHVQKDKGACVFLRPCSLFVIHSAILSVVVHTPSYSHRYSPAPPRTYTRTNNTAFGDLGAGHAYSLCRDYGTHDHCICNDTSAGIVSEVGVANMALHVGDFACESFQPLHRGWHHKI